MNIPSVAGLADAVNKETPINSVVSPGETLGPAAPAVRDTASIRGMEIHGDIREREARQERREEPDPRQVAPRTLFDLKAVFALDEDKNTVIRFLDDAGEVVRQIPPEEYLNMVNTFRRTLEYIFSDRV